MWKSNILWKSDICKELYLTHSRCSINIGFLSSGYSFNPLLKPDFNSKHKCLACKGMKGKIWDISWRFDSSDPPHITINYNLLWLCHWMDYKAMNNAFRGELSIIFQFMVMSILYSIWRRECGPRYIVHPTWNNYP